jgi:beta-fructofuranosidase
MIQAVSAIMDDGGVHHAAAESANAPLLPETNLKGRRPPARQKRPSTVLPAIGWTVLLLSLFGLAVYRPWRDHGQASVTRRPEDQVAAAGRVVEVAATRGVVQGVSEKSTAPALLGGGGAYDWTNVMLSWQRTAFHFQPEKNWMNGRYVAIAILPSCSIC